MKIGPIGLGQQISARPFFFFIIQEENQNYFIKTVYTVTFTVYTITFTFYLCKINYMTTNNCSTIDS